MQPGKTWFQLSQVEVVIVFEFLFRSHIEGLALNVCGFLLILDVLVPIECGLDCFFASIGYFAKCSFLLFRFFQRSFNLKDLKTRFKLMKFLFWIILQIISIISNHRTNFNFYKLF